MRTFHALLLGGALAAAVAGLGTGCGPKTACSDPGAVCRVIGNGDQALDTNEGTAALETPTYLVQDITFGPGGDGYYIDWNNHRIRDWDATDDTITTVCGSGITGDGPEGPATATAMNHPTGLTFDPNGAMIVAAWHNSKIKRVDLLAETIEDICGTGMRGFGGDGGPCEMAVLDLPSSVAYDSAGNLYISDQANNRIRRVDTSGIITTWAGTGLGTGINMMTMLPNPECLGASPSGTEDCFSGDGGPALMATLNNPRGQAAPPAGRIIIDADDNVYVADTANHVIRRIEATGMNLVTTIAGTGGMSGYAGDGGSATSALLSSPSDIALDPVDGTLFIADTRNDCVRAVATDGTISTAAGVCGSSGYEADATPAAESHLNRPYGVEVGPDGNLYISDTENNVVRVLNRALAGD
jgi:hypothetical protein